SGHGQDVVEVSVREGLRDRGGVGLLALSVLLIPFDLDPGVLEGLLETVAGGVERRVLHQLRDADLERVLLTASAVAAAGAGRNREYRTDRPIAVAIFLRRSLLPFETSVRWCGSVTESARRCRRSSQAME